MPKGKAKKHGPNLYANSSRTEASTVSQSVARRRGGVRGVKYKDLTNSKHDDYDYNRLVMESKERKLYMRDDKKVEMARKLQDDDIKNARAEREVVNERQRQHEAKKRVEQRRRDEKAAADVARKKRQLEKDAAKDRGEDVNPDEYSLDDPDQIHNRLVDKETYTKIVPVGHISSDESWESTATESTVHLPDLPTVPHDKLLFLSGDTNRCHHESH